MSVHYWIKHWKGIQMYVERCNKAIPITSYTFQSAFFLLFAGRVAQLQGQFDAALGHFDRCYKIQNEWKQLHNVCFWESLWCHAYVSFMKISFPG